MQKILDDQSICLLGCSMDPQFLEREKELLKLNANLNAKSRKMATSKNIQVKTVQIHTANNNLNFEPCLSAPQESEENCMELMCKRINISTQSTKKTQEIIYPLFHRQAAKSNRLNIQLPISSTIADGNAEISNEIDTVSVDIKTETIDTLSLKNESLVTRHSDDTSVITHAEPTPCIIKPPSPCMTDDIEIKFSGKKIGNDGLLK